MARLDFSLTLNEQLYAELIDNCKASGCSPKQFAAESLESVLAGRRLDRADVALNSYVDLGATVSAE